MWMEIKPSLKIVDFLGVKTLFLLDHCLQNQRVVIFLEVLEKEHQEKLYANTMRGCYIKGDVDFIFGSATAVFKDCEIFSNNRDKSVNGYITAASTIEGERFGYVFIDCRLISDAKHNSVYLGRPWRDYAKTTFINCFMGEHIVDSGWHNWDRLVTQSTTSYEEYNSSGPGGNQRNRVTWAKVLTDEEVKEYTPGNIFGLDFNYGFYKS